MFKSWSPCVSCDFVRVNVCTEPPCLLGKLAQVWHEYALNHVWCCRQALPEKPTMSAQYINISLSLIGLVALAGAGVAVGSGVGMAAMAMAEEEQKQKGISAIAHSVIEKKPTPGSGRGFAAGSQ